LPATHDGVVVVVSNVQSVDNNVSDRRRLSQKKFQRNDSQSETSDVSDDNDTDTELSCTDTVDDETTFEELCGMEDATNNGWTGDDADDALFLEVSIALSDQLMRLVELSDELPSLSGSVCAAVMATTAAVMWQRNVVSGIGAACGLSIVAVAGALRYFRRRHRASHIDRQRWRRSDAKARRLAAVGVHLRRSIDLIELLLRLGCTLPGITSGFALIVAALGYGSLFTFLWMFTVAFLLEKLMVG
jgi:hypothetical protein